ncbi:hypothetical protein AB4Z45_32005 [Paenibacillus sp. MCAF9]|uniref:hypothetical protein n=1 Tax=Paenibacillus sp. MCAF9 TaxID=3233046 RepID=UPI003F9E211F
MDNRNTVFLVIQDVDAASELIEAARRDCKLALEHGWHKHPLRRKAIIKEIESLRTVRKVILERFAKKECTYSVIHDFKAVAAHYELLVVKEDESCVDVVGKSIQSLLAYGHEYDNKTVEALQNVQEQVLVELSRIRIQKGYMPS